MSARKIVLAVTLVGLPLIGGLYAVMTPRVPKPTVFVPIAEDSELWQLTLQARGASRAGEHRRAVRLYARALAIDSVPSTFARDLHAARGSEYNFLDMPDKAYADYDAALRIGFPDPASSAAIRAHMGRGYALVGVGHYAEAKDDFDVVLGLVPREVPRASSTLAWRGAAHQGLGDRARAIADYQAALALDPTNTYARNGLSDLEAPQP